MQIYSKSTKNATSLFLGRFWFCLFYLIGLGGGFKTSTQNFWNSLIMQIYANLFKINEKCYFSSISWPILILFVLSDRAGWGLQNFYTEFWNSLIMQIYANFIQNQWEMLLLLYFLADFWFCLFYLIGLGGGFKTVFYTEFWNSLIMQIYANLFKINEKCYMYFSVISWPILILFALSDRAWCGLQNFCTELWNSLIMQIYAHLFKINEKCYFSVISWPILILFVLSDRAWCGLQNFYTEFWNALIMQMYSKSMKNATSPLFRNHNRSALPAGTYINAIA